MSPELLAVLEDLRKYLQNRERFPADELLQYAGQWIAWSPDGERIVANSANPEELDELIRKAGGDPERMYRRGYP